MSRCIKLSKEFTEEKFKELFGNDFDYSILEGGYISADGSTIVVINRAPYYNTVMQFGPNAERFHSWCTKLSNNNMLEEVIK